MKYLKKPTDNAKDVFLTCISKVQNPELKSALTKLAPAIVTISNEYEGLATKHSLHKVRQQKRFSAPITIAEIIKVYTQRMVPADTPGHEIYNRIKANAPGGKCPLCKRGLVTTVDHYLDKAAYPMLSVVPLNLVPACKDCNWTKNKHPLPSSSSDETLHPYFDDLGTSAWIKATIIKKPFGVVFAVKPKKSWTTVTQKRVEKHFNLFELGEQYAKESASELTSIKYGLIQSFNAGGSEAVKTDLQKQAKSRGDNDKNTWSAALYSAIASSNWFCSGGFNEI
jgi:5-methylcytosine-specific restriction endonuclease McrA